MTACTEVRFLGDVAKHEMEIIRDDGVCRHLRFMNKDLICNWFNLITWSGHLCVTGDYGTYVFARLPDMFKFFRNDPKNTKEKRLFINKGYWAEKVLSVDRNGSVTEFSKTLFEDAVKHHYETFFEDCDDEKKKSECLEAIQERVLDRYENEYEAVVAVNEFEHDGFIFQDFFDYTIRDYTYRYVWNLYAIVWGISQYDQKAVNEIATG